MFNDYLLKCHKNGILIILKDTDIDKHFSVIINFVELFEVDSNLGSAILSQPESNLKKCNDCIREVQRILISEAEDAGDLWEKINVHTRIFGLPKCPEVHRNIFPKNNDLGLFLEVSGTIVRMTSRKMLEYRREYTCKKCKYKLTIEADYDKKYVILVPKRCKNPEPCTGANMVATSELDSNHCKDYQEVKIQEQTNKLDVGKIPNAMWVTLEDDLVETCKPGDNITVCGIVCRRWKPPTVGKKLDLQLVIKANHLQITNDTTSSTVITSEIIEQFDHFWDRFKEIPLYGRDLILRSFCPQIFGMYFVKLAVATTLAGGSSFQKYDNTGVRKRTEPHLLLVGDPGMGKSQLLKYAAKVIPRSVLTTGVGSTSAGLTVTAMMEDGEWHLEGGALVLADGGICCIDEFNSMKEHDKASIHEAMEQQTISVAKASIVSKLNTRCSILAATNPKAQLDTNQPLSINIALASPLLSRFDLIFLIKDNIDDDWDARVSDFILRGNKHKSKFIEKKNNSWSLEMLQAYFTIIKRNNPELSETTRRILGAYYQLQRNSEERNKARTTVRLLDSLVRLSQAHARLMYHKEVETMDAITAIILVEASMQGDSNILRLNVEAGIDFPDDPMKFYDEASNTILEKLNLTNDIRIPIHTSTQNDNAKNGERNVIDITISQIAKLNNIGNDKYKMERKQDETVKIVPESKPTALEKKRRKLIGNKTSSKKRKIVTNSFENDDDIDTVLSFDDCDKPTKSNSVVKEREPETDDILNALNFSLDADEHPAPTLERPDISQSTKIKLIREKFQFKRNAKSFDAKTDSGNFSTGSSNRSIFETDEETNLDL